MLGDLTKYGSGPNSPAWQSMRGRMVQLGLGPDNWTDGVAAQENFVKMANQFLAKQAASMGGAVSNDKLALAAESGPNPLFTTVGNQGVLHIAQGNEDALNVKNQAWAQAQLPQSQGGQGLTGADFQNWSTQFNQGFSPSAFWYSRMAPAERQTFVAGLAPTQQAQLHGAIVNGIDRGWINPTLLTQPAAGMSAAPPAGAPPQPASTPPTAAAAPASQPPMPPSYSLNGMGTPAIAGGY